MRRYNLSLGVLLLVACGGSPTPVGGELDALGVSNDPVIAARGGSSGKCEGVGISGISAPPLREWTGHLGPRGPGWGLRRGHLGLICECPQGLRPVVHDAFPVVARAAVDVVLIVDGAIVQDDVDGVVDGLERLTDQLASMPTDWRVGVLDVEGSSPDVGRLRTAAGIRWVDSETVDVAQVLQRMLPLASAVHPDADVVFDAFQVQSDVPENIDFRRDVSAYVALLINGDDTSTGSLSNDPMVTAEGLGEREASDFLGRFGVAATGRATEYFLSELPDMNEGIAVREAITIDGLMVSRRFRVCVDPSSDSYCDFVYRNGSNSIRPLRWLPSAGTVVHVEYEARQATAAGW